MRILYTDSFVLPLPAGHRFPMDKYSRLRRRVQAADWSRSCDLRVPDPATDDELALAHCETYLQRVRDGSLEAREQRRIGFPWSPEMVERSRRSVGATLGACRFALTDGLAVNLAGGTHHAFRDAGEGFCVFNDSVVAARALQREGHVQRVLVIDCDVHQGNGTAALCRDDRSVFTFSIHGAKNFPFRKERSDLDVALVDGTVDRDYLDALEQGLTQVFDSFSPDLAIYLAGADPWQGDRWGRLALTKSGLAERDRIVLDACFRHDLPVAVTMAGGYAPEVDDTVDIHFETVRLAASSRS